MAFFARRTDPVAIYDYIRAEKAKDDPDSALAVMCRVLAVSRSGYYDWLARGEGNPPNG